MLSNEMCLKRAIERRYDNHNHSLYHLDTNPLPVDNAPLIDRIKSLYEVDNLQQQISDKNSYFMTQIQGLQNWYNCFESKSGQNIQNAFVNIDASNNYERVFYDVDQIFQNFLQIQVSNIQQKFEDQQNKILEQEESLKQQQEFEEQEKKCQFQQVTLDTLPSLVKHFQIIQINFGMLLKINI